MRGWLEMLLTRCKLLAPHSKHLFIWEDGRPIKDFRRSWEKACESAGLPDLLFHDLRRTAATRMGDLRVQPHVIECVLNHASGFRDGVGGIYNLSTYRQAMREALELWANHLTVAVAQAEGANVARIKRV